LFEGGIGEEKLWMKKPKFLLFVYSTHKKLHNDIGLEGKICSTQEQAVRTTVTDVIKEL